MQVALPVLRRVKRIASCDERIQRERVILWSDDLLFYQRAKDASLNWGESHRLRVPHRESSPYLK